MDDELDKLYKPKKIIPGFSVSSIGPRGKSKNELNKDSDLVQTARLSAHQR